MAHKRPHSLLSMLRFIAFAATLLGSYKLVSTALFFNSSLQTQGIVIDFALNDELFGPNKTPLIAYIDFSNRKHISTPESALGSEYLFLGQKVPIRYNGSDPSIVRIDTFLGMWGTGGINILFGLVPLIALSFLGGGAPARSPAKRRSGPRKSTLKVKHLVNHTTNVAESDRPVVRRMR